MIPQLWVLTFEPSDFKHFKAENISMFFLQNEFLCRFVILSFTKGFHSQHMSCTILRTHSLCVNGVSDILRVLTSDKVTPNVFTQWSMILLSWLLLHLSTFFKCHLIWQSSQIHTSSSASVPVFWQPWSEEIQQTPEWALYHIPPQTVGLISNTHWTLTQTLQYL